MPVASPSTPPGLTVHQVELDVHGSALAIARTCLDGVERARADRGTATVARRRTVLRATLRSLLGAALDCRPTSVPLVTGPHGRPRLAGRDHGWDFSCTRRDGIGLVVLARGCRVGIDIEQIRPWSVETVDEGWLSGDEVDQLLALPAARRPRAAARCWAEKEATLKAVGTGLLTDPALIRTTPGTPTAATAGWLLTPVAVPPGFEASLASSDRTAPRAPTIVPIPAPTPWTAHA